MKKYDLKVKGVQFIQYRTGSCVLSSFNGSCSIVVSFGQVDKLHTQEILKIQMVRGFFVIKMEGVEEWGMGNIYSSQLVFRAFISLKQDPLLVNSAVCIFKVI